MALSPTTASRLKSYLDDQFMETPMRLNPAGNSGILAFDNPNTAILNGTSDTGILGGTKATPQPKQDMLPPVKDATDDAPDITASGNTSGTVQNSINGSNNPYNLAGPNYVTPTPPPTPTPETTTPTGTTTPATTTTLPPLPQVNLNPGSPSSYIGANTTTTGSPAGTTPAPGTTTTTTNNSTATVLDPAKLTQRTIDPNELVQNQMNGILGANNEFLTNEEARAQRAAATRGLSNSTIAASAGREAAIRAALPIAQADAATFGRAGDYNTALGNQGYMYNVEAENNFKKLGLQIDADKATQERAIQAQLQVAGINAAASGASAAANLEAARMSAETSRLNALLNAETSRGNQNSQNATNIYNQRLGLARDILMNQDMPSDYKQKLLNGLGDDFKGLAANVFLDKEVDKELQEAAKDKSNTDVNSYRGIQL